jgi:Protein of unknown function (DUF2637)
VENAQASQDTTGRAVKLAVGLVAAIAAVVSYTHVYDLGRTHGQTGLAARLLPLSVDGLVVVASLVLLQSARNGHQSSALPRFALWLGIAFTVATNLAYGLPHGPVGAVLSAWPGAAFVLAVEILLGSLRSSQEAPEPEALFSASRAREGGQETVPEPSQPVPEGPSVQAAQSRTRPSSPLPTGRSTTRGMSLQPAELFRAEIEAGHLPPVREVKRRAHVGQDRASQIRAEIKALMNDTVEATS